MPAAPTVFVIDDDPGALRSLCWMLQQADLNVKPFASAGEFLESRDAMEPGCLVLDVKMPEIGGLELQQRLLDRGIQLPIIFITAFGDVATCAHAFRAGAFDFLEKPLDDEVLVRHVRKALARDAQRRQQQLHFATLAGQLTPREKEVLQMLLSGKSLKEIASATNVTVQSVWRHRGSILAKMQVKNEVELVRLAASWSPAPDATAPLVARQG